MTAKALAITAAQVSAAMAFMLAQRGKPYSEALSGSLFRLGPNAYDSSGRVSGALHKMGIAIPQDQSTANTEADWLSENGAQVIKDASQLKPGDFVFFSSGDNGPSNFGGMGHTGRAVGGGNYISAYDHADGIVVKPLSGDQFVVGMRVTNQTVGPGDGGAPAAAPGGGGGILGIDWGNIPQDFQDFD